MQENYHRYLKLLIYMLLNRLNVLYYYLLSKNNVTIKQMVKYLFSMSYNYKANRIIREVIMDGDWQKVYLNNNANPIYYPRALSSDTLKQVIVECFDKYNWHYYEIEQTQVQRDDIVVDCGAAEGLFTFMVKSRCKCVYAIEPLKIFVESLSYTFNSNDNVYIIDQAISDREYYSKMSNRGILSAIENGGSGDTIKVTTLDKLFYEKNIPVSYIKMDLEGYDYVALLGGKKLIKKYTPKIAVTTYHNVNHACQIKELLLDINPKYKIVTKGIFQMTGGPIMLHAWT